LLDRLAAGFTLLCIDSETADVPTSAAVAGQTLTKLDLSARDNAFLAERYLGDAASGVYLIRPDQHIAARWAAYDADAVAHALRTTMGEG
ncbi:MAG: FAD-dependent oxidoreductase, partial [Pseudomonadota bacterium]